MPSFTVRSELGVAPEVFWQGMSMSAVNAELWPLIRMTTPASWCNCPLEQWTSGAVLFRSVVLLFGFLPVDVHSLRLEHIDPAKGFVEGSHSWMNALWQHERVTTRMAAGCMITDTVAVQSRIPGVGAMLMPLYRGVFRHRHRRMRSLYKARSGR